MAQRRAARAVPRVRQRFAVSCARHGSARYAAVTLHAMMAIAVTMMPIYALMRYYAHVATRRFRHGYYAIRDYAITMLTLARYFQRYMRHCDDSYADCRR